MPSPLAIKSDQPPVRRYHASLVWPLQLALLLANGIKRRHLEAFERDADRHPLCRIDDEFTDDPCNFKFKLQ